MTDHREPPVEMVKYEDGTWRPLDLSPKVDRFGRPFDYMHAKAVVADDEGVTGSFNCLRHGESNAENVLHVTDEPIAERFAAFADAVAARYAVSPAGGGSA